MASFTKDLFRSPQISAAAFTKNKLNGMDIKHDSSILFEIFFEVIKVLHQLRLKVALISLLVLISPSLLFGIQSDEKAATVIVAKKDNLVNICKTWLENPLKWPTVARFNRLENPHLIYPGQHIKIPVKLIKGIPMNGWVSFLKGKVFAYSHESNEPWRLKQDDIVKQGTEIETKKESAVEITFTDGSSFFLRPDTRINIRDSRQRQPYYMIRQLFMPAGRIFLRIKESTGQDSKFEIQTPSAVSAARGTRFRVSVDQENVTRTEVLDGSVGVKGEGQEVVLNTGQGTWVEDGESANAPEPLPDPPEIKGLRTMYQQLPVTFTIIPSEKAVACRLEIAKDPGMKDVVNTSIIKAGVPIPRITLPDAGYYCQVTAINKARLEGIPTKPSRFDVRVNPLPPFIQAPLDGSEIKTDGVTLEWLRVEDAASYEIQVTRQSDFKTLYKKIKNITGNSQHLGIDDYGPYYFRIRSIAKDDFIGIWSDVVTFTHVEPPKAPKTEAPAVDENTISLRWQNLGAEMIYEFQMAKDPDFKNILIEKNTESADITFNRPKEGGIYYVRVRAVDPDGYKGMFTPAQTFEIKTFPYLEIGTVLTWIVGALIIIF